MQVNTIGIDIAKDVFQVHGVDANDKVVFNKPLRRSQILPFFDKLAPCLIGMEACASAHYWARELKKIGHDVRLMPAKDVKAYVKRNKNDTADAAACCEAVRRPTVRTVPVKTRRPARTSSARRLIGAGEDARAAGTAHATPRARPARPAAYPGRQCAAFPLGGARHRRGTRLRWRQGTAFRRRRHQ